MKNKILSFLLVMLASTSYAQEVAPVEESQSEQSQIPVEQVATEDEGIDTLDDYEVTAYRFGTPQLDTPVNTTVISADDIAESFSTNIADVLQKKANVQFHNSDNAALSTISMRGYGDASSRVLVIIDGQRMNRPDMGNINWQQIPLEYIESIEVMRGSQSAMYGNNAVAGVIKITTKKGTEDNKYSLNLQGGSNDYYSVNGLITGSTDGWYYSASVGRTSDDGYRDANSYSWTNSYNLSVSTDISDALSASVTANFAESKFGMPGSVYLSQYNDNPYQTWCEDDYYAYNEGVFTAALNSKTSFGEGEVALSGSFRDSKYYMVGHYPNNITYNDEWHLYFTPKYKFNVTDDINFITGLDVEYIHIDSDFNSTWGSYYDDIAELQRYSIAPYIAGDITLDERFIFNAAIRYEYTMTQAECYGHSNYDDDLKSEGFAANVGLTYRVDENSSVYFRFDQIYRYPTTEEIASYNGYTSMVTPFNTDLDPEHGQNYEIGYKYIDRNWTVNLNGFFQYLEDEIYYASYTAYTGLNENYNDPTLRYGIDYQVAYDDKYWGASIMGTMQQAEFASGEYKGNRIPLVSNFTNTFSVYVKPVERLRLTLDLIYNSDSPYGGDLENSQANMSDYFLLNISLRLKLSENATIYAGIDNLLDETYMAYGSYSASNIYGINDGYSIIAGEGRTFKVGLNLTF